MTILDNLEDSFHNNNDHKNIKEEITYLYGKEVLMIFFVGKMT